MNGRKELRTSARIAATAFAMLLMLASAAFAQAPSIHFNTIGTTHYHAGTDTLDIAACADRYMSPELFAIIGGNCGQVDAPFHYGAFTISASVNDLGQLTGGVLTVTGSIPDGGLPTVEVLLTGNALTFESTAIGGDELRFKFSVTGGLLAGRFIGHDLAVRVGLELGEKASTFDGSFAADFEGGAEGTIDGVEVEGGGGGGGGGELPRCTVPGTADTGGTGTIGDRVWNDANRNGIQDADENGLGAVPLNLYSWDETTATWNHILDVVSSDTGAYIFQNLCHGTYKVEAGTPDEYTASAINRADSANDSDSNPSIVLLETDDSEDLTIDFGFYVTPEGPFTTFTQAEWGSKPRGSNPGMLLKNNFEFVYPASLYPSGVVIGDAASACSTAAPYKINVTSALAIQEFLPQSHPVRALLRCQTNPGKKVSFLAGQALALTLNVAFSYVGVTRPGLGSLLVIRGPLTGRTVDQVLEIVNCMLSGQTATACGVPGLTLKQANKAARLINRNFPGGTRHRNVLALPESSAVLPTSFDSDEEGED